MEKFAFIIFILLNSIVLSAQDDLLSLLEDEETEELQKYTTSTFKTVRLINGYSAETAGKKDLVFSISHRFGSMSGGAYEFFGLDESTIRFGFEYGLSDRISLGFGRSNYNKLYDGFIKLKLARQCSGAKSFPLTLTWLSGTSVKTIKWGNQDLDYPFSARMYYVHELFIARKFSDRFSAQLMPVVVHRNMVEIKEEQNIVPAIGIGGTFDVNHWLSLSTEYYHLLPGYTADNYYNSLAVGVEMETGGGHVFQVHIGNGRGMTEKAFIPETVGRWKDGDISIGFNIIRVFNLDKNR